MLRSFKVHALTRTLVVLAGLIWAPVNLKAAQDLSDAEEVLERTVEAYGGRDAFDELQNRVSTGTLEFVDQGIKIDIKVVSARPNRSRVTLSAEAIGEVDSGTDGLEVWENSTLQGPALKSGEERASRLAEVVFERFIYWEDNFEQAKIEGKEEVEGHACIHLTLMPKNPIKKGEFEMMPLHLFVDTENYLIRKVVTKAQTPAGVIDVEVLNGDYREIDGIMISHKAETLVLGQRRVLTIESIEHNVELPADQFSPPADIQRLIDRRDK